MSLICRGFQFLFFLYIILELKANFTVRRHILLFFYYFVDWIMRKENGGKRGRKKMDEREKESEFVKLHPELYDKEHPRFHDKTRREALWAEISAELKLQPFDVRRWFESQRTHYGKLSKLQSGQGQREMTKRQSWVYQQMGFLKTHIRRKGANRSSGFEASPNTSRQDESRGSTTDTEHLESSVLRERSQSIITSTPVSTTVSRTL